MDVYGYAGDGAVSVADGTSPGVWLGTFDPTTGNGPRTLFLDRDALAGLLSTTSTVGLRFVTTPDSQARVDTTASNRPALTLFRDAVAVPTVSAVNGQVIESDVPHPFSAGPTVQMPLTVSLSIRSPSRST